jgi:hypothetical protein
MPVTVKISQRAGLHELLNADTPASDTLLSALSMSSF